ncbi:hypothetical protein Hbl1158_08985 [Halobaculum sp. CBA1158]|uniref:hypothetical protein n=1 Tax=Halobaculum sp. CBA1158 TaxID=2904243 RepID=UPI001F45A914|nr:hypothetical protein [Halobaculum sp. CBA1158]UIO98688.1 hypothetical protein Hbl1158_08985 [Halobaculum sp. CBA1158]
MDRGRLVRALRPAGVGLAAALGGGLLYLPGGVAQGAGPQAPAAYLVAGGGAVCLAVAFGVAAGVGGERGPVYGSIARASGSRRLGALAAWAALGGYVGLLGLLAEWLGRLAPLPAGTGAYVQGTLDEPTGPAAVLGLAPPGALASDALAVAVCALAFAVHLLGRRRAALAAAVPAWAVVAGVGALLAAAFLPGVGEFVPANFDPLYPTSGLRADPVGALVGGVALALFAFVGIESAAYAAEATGSNRGDDDTDADGVDGDRARDGSVVAAAVAGALVALTALVALGVINWARLTLADIPAADAIGAYLPVDPLGLTVLVSVVAGLAALVALGVPAARTLAGLAELAPPLARGPDEPPVVPLAVVYAAAATLAVADIVDAALYVAVPGLAFSYLAVAVTALATAMRRPDLLGDDRGDGTSDHGGGGDDGDRGDGTTGEVDADGVRVPLVLALAAAVAVAATLATVTFSSDPATTLGLTLHRVALAVFEFELVSDPLGGVIPAIIVWELIGLGLLFVLADYRVSVNATLPPLDADDAATASASSEDDSGPSNGGDTAPSNGGDPNASNEDAPARDRRPEP